MNVFLCLVVAFLALATAAFCAGAETGFLSVSRERILHLAREGGRKARIVQEILSDMARTTITLLIGNNLANVCYSAASAAFILEVWHGQTAQSLASFGAAFLILYVSEFLPKLLFAARPLHRTLRIAPAYRLLARILHPLVVLAMAITNIFVRNRGTKYRLTSADLMRILQDRKDGVCLSDFESALIGRILILRVKGRPITPESLLSCLRDEDAGKV